MKDKLHKNSILLTGCILILLILPLISYANDNPDFGPYMKRLNKQIKADWNENQTIVPSGLKFIAKFRIDKKGNISNIMTKKTSGNNTFDQEALSSITESSPFEPLPSSYTGSSIDVEFKFESKFKSRNSASNYIFQDIKKLDNPAIPNKTPINISANNQNSILERINLIEKTLGIENQQLNVIERLSKIEISIFGKPQANSILNRILCIENSLKSNQISIEPNLKPKKTALEQLSSAIEAPLNNKNELKSTFQLSTNNPIINNKPILGSYKDDNPSFQNNIRNNLDFIPKKSNNVMNWNYDANAGSYLGTLFLKNTNDKELGFPIFQKFPVKYWIQPMNASMQQPIRTAITEYNYYFPMQEVSSRNKADLTFEIVDYPTLEKNCKTARYKHALACGGPQYSVSQIGYIKGIVNYKASVWIDIESFRIRNLYNTVLHEMGHAFGITIHSNNTKDIMFESSQLIYNNDGSLIQINEPGKLSPRDLNTLFLIYNQY